jgi:hypothetical protein
LRVAQFAKAQVDHPLQEGQARRPGTHRGREGGGLAPQDGIDPRQQFARIERFRHVVVGSHFEADDAVEVLAARGEHDDRGLRGRPDASAEAQAVLAGQHHVEHDQVDPALAEAAVHLVTVGGDRHAAGVGLKIARDEAAGFAIVLDDQDLWRS